MLENFEDHEFLNGQNFSKIADVVFTINVPNEDLSSFNIEDYKIITKNTEFTGLKIKNLEIKNGDVVFCNSNYLSLFFKYLERLKKQYFTIYAKVLMLDTDKLLVKTGSVLEGAKERELLEYMN